AAGRSRTATLAPARHRAPTERADPVLLRSERPRANSICRSPPALPRRQPRLSPLGRWRATAPPFRARAPALRAEPAAQPRYEILERRRRLLQASLSSLDGQLQPVSGGVEDDAFIAA